MFNIIYLPIQFKGDVRKRRFDGATTSRTINSNVNHEMPANINDDKRFVMFRYLKILHVHSKTSNIERICR
jgi:hypothetical protein